MTLSGVLLKFLHIVVVVGLVLPLLAALLVWAERKVSAFIQDRLGPNRVGPAGLLQAIADLGKFIFKEDVVPSHVHKWMYVLAPALALTPAMIT
ncbi:MAG: NADH-quinone oxidoreductase subunit H, partial [Planctomycetota bacterium]